MGRAADTGVVAADELLAAERHLGVVGGELNIDFLVGAGAVGIVDTCSVTLGEFARTGPNFARYVTGARVRALDNT